MSSTLRAPPTIRTKCGPLREYIVCIRDKPPFAPVCESGRSSSNRDGSGGASSPSRRSDASGSGRDCPDLGNGRAAEARHAGGVVQVVLQYFVLVLKTYEWRYGGLLGRQDGQLVGCH